ncbi:MAG: hypothetical protein ACQR33_06210 [Candidatus Saccharibacteria bacterium]
MKQFLSSLIKSVSSAKLVAGFVVVASVAVVATSSVAAAAPSYFSVPKPTKQKVCYTQYGGAGWKALGFKDLDNCLRYVSTPAPKAKSDCNTGYWYVFGFNSRGQCVAWVVQHGGSGYAGDPNEWY